MSKITIVSDISRGWAIHGNAGSTFCIKLIDPVEGVTTFSGKFKSVWESETMELETHAALIGISMAVDQGYMDITAYIDNDPAIMGLKPGTFTTWAKPFREYLKMLRKKGANIQIKRTPTHLMGLHEDCHFEAVMRLKQYFGDGNFKKLQIQDKKRVEQVYARSPAVWK